MPKIHRELNLTLCILTFNIHSKESRRRKETTKLKQVFEGIKQCAIIFFSNRCMNVKWNSSHPTVTTILKNFYHDVKNYTWAELWRIFLNCGRLKVNVAGLPWLTAHAEPWLYEFRPWEKKWKLFVALCDVAAWLKNIWKGRNTLLNQFTTLSSVCLEMCTLRF